MGDEQDGHETSRLDRVEGLMELLIDDHLKFSDEHKSLLTSQVLLTDQVGKLAGTMETFAGTMATFREELEKLAGITRQVADSQKELYKAQKHTDERMNALIAGVDDLIRNRPN